MTPVLSKRSESNTPSTVNPGRLGLSALFLALAWTLAGCVPESLPPQPPAVPKAADAFEKGLRDFREGLYDSAAKEFQAVPPAHPKAKLAHEYYLKAAAHVVQAFRHLSTAEAYEAQGELYKARQELEEILEAYPRYRNTRTLVESLDRQIDQAVQVNFDRGKEAYDKKQYEQARESFLLALKANPDDGNAAEWLSLTEKILSKLYYEEGRVLAGRGSLDEAIARLESSHQLNPTDPAIVGELTVAYNRRALKHYRDEDLSLAVHDLKRSLELQPEQKEIQGQLRKVQRQIDLLRRIGP